MRFNASDVNPYIRRAIPSVLSGGTTISRRIIFDYELIYIEKGEFILNYNENNYLCQNGDFILICPGVPHSFNNIINDVSQPHIHFDITYDVNSPDIPISFKDIDNFTEKEKRLIRPNLFDGLAKTPFVKFNNEKIVLSLFYSIIGDPQKKVSLTKKARLTEIIDILITDNYPSLLSLEKGHYSIATQVKDYIDAEQGLTAELCELEKQFSYSKYHLERHFKSEYGMGIMAYRNKKRIDKAKELLKDMSVSKVCERLGYSSIYVFSRAFKNAVGISPTQYKNK